MSRRPLSKTGLFISDDDKSSSETSAELWTNSPIAFATGRRGGGEIKIDDTGDLNSNSMSALKVALRASRVRASAAVAKASRLQEEVTRLRDTLKAKSRRADRADELQSDLAKSELRVRELESEKRKVDRALEEMRTVARKREAKAKQSLASLRLTLKGVEDREEERCTRWRSTTRSLRALLESLRRHLQRGLHATPSFTAFQLLEQLFLCLEDKEREARSRQGGASPGAVDAAHGEAKNIPREDGRRRRGSVPQGGEASGSDEEDGGRGKVQGRAEELGSPSSSKRLSTISSLHRENETLRKALDEASASQAASAAAANADVTGREAAIETTRSRFPTEGLYRLAVTKLSTQLQAAREKSRSEKEALRSTGERAAQEELRCQELELELEGMKASVEAAQARTRGLESSLKRAREERDRLERRQQSAVTRALYAALGIAHDTPASFPPMPPPAPAATATETATKATIDLPPGRSRDETLDARAAPIRTPSLHPVLAGELAGGRGRGALGSIATDGTASTSAFPLGETRTSRSPASARARYTNRSQSVGARVSSTGEASRWRQTGDRESALSTKGTASPSGAVDADETIRPTAGDHRGSGVRSATTPGLRDDNDVKLSAVGELGVGGGVDGVPGERAGLKVRVTQEDLARLDEEIANLTKAVEQAALNQTRQILRNVMASVERHAEEEVTAAGTCAPRD